MNTKLITLTAFIITAFSQQVSAAAPDFDLLDLKLGISTAQAKEKIKSLGKMTLMQEITSQDGVIDREKIYEYCYGDPWKGSMRSPQGVYFGCEDKKLTLAFTSKTDKLWKIVRIDNLLPPYGNFEKVPLNNLIDGLNKKYGTPQSVVEIPVLAGRWAYDPNGSPTKAKECAVHELDSKTIFSPPREQCGVSLFYSLTSQNSEKKFAHFISMMLKSDQIALESFKIQDNAAAQSKKTQDDKDLKSKAMPKL